MGNNIKDSKSEDHNHNEDVNNPQIEDLINNQFKDETIVNDVQEANINPEKDIEALPKKTELELTQEELQASKDRYLRLFAEFENYKKRTNKERLELFKTAGQEVIQSLLPVLDDFDRALKEISKSGESQVYEGLSLIGAKLNETLKNKGLGPMHVEAGDVFDADLHEAITQIPAPTEDLKGKIIDVVELGYTLGEKIIRYPKVVTGK